MKKLITLTLALCLMVSMTTGYAFNIAAKEFTDIQNHWAKDFITSLTQKGIIGGYPDDTFRPDNKIKVTEFTVLVLKAKDIEIPTTEKWYQGAMDTAASEEIVKNGEFDTLDTRQINRGEMARMIVRALDENASSGDTWFKDDESIPSSIKGYVKKAAELGIIGGYPDGSFKHDGYATRAEASTMISKMIQVMNGETLPVQKPEKTDDEKVRTEIWYDEYGIPQPSDINYLPSSSKEFEGGFGIRRYNDATLNYYKEELKKYFPDKYKEVYKKTVEVINEEIKPLGVPNFTGYYDNRLVKIKKYDKSIGVTIGKEGVK